MWDEEFLYPIKGIPGCLFAFLSIGLLSTMVLVALLVLLTG